LTISDFLTDRQPVSGSYMVMIYRQ